MGNCYCIYNCCQKGKLIVNHKILEMMVVFLEVYDFLVVLVLEYFDFGSIRQVYINI